MKALLFAAALAGAAALVVPAVAESTGQTWPGWGFMSTANPCWTAASTMMGGWPAGSPRPQYHPYPAN
jgi:hypothetical protein